MGYEEVCGVTAVDRRKVGRVRRKMMAEEQISRMAYFFQAFSDLTRLKIILALEVEKELCVCDLTMVVGVSMSAVSHQLRYLRNLGVVKNRKQGKMVYYSLKDEHIKELIHTVTEHIHEE